MLKKKFLLGVTLSMALCFSSCSGGDSEVTETTVSAEVTAAPETTAATSETTTEATTEATAEIIDTSGVEYMKEALQAEWDDSEYDRYAVSVVNLYTADLNGDGVKELFVNYSFGAAMNGLVYVYDVSDGMKKLYDISARMWAEKSELYKDENGTVHLILKEGYAGGIGELDTAYFDIAYDSIKMPIYVNEYDWYDGGAHLLAYDLYKNCEFAPLDFINDFSGWRNFDPEKAEYIGRFDTGCVWDAIEYDKSNEISEIIQKEVYENMTYVSDIEMIYEFKHYNIIWDFEYFWQEAAPKLAEIYG